METVLNGVRFTQCRSVNVVICQIIPIGLAVIYNYYSTRRKNDDDKKDDRQNTSHGDSDVMDDDIDQQQHGEDPKAHMVPKFRVDVQVYTPQQSHLDFVHNLEELLATEDSTIDLVIKENGSIKDIKSGHPLLVACMFASRLGTDAKNAVKGIKDSKSAVLLVFHHKDEHALPKQPSSRVLVDSEFEDLYGIYDIACLTGKGVYPCDMNKEAVTNIVKFIKSFQHGNE